MTLTQNHDHYHYHFTLPIQHLNFIDLKLLKLNLMFAKSSYFMDYHFDG